MAESLGMNPLGSCKVCTLTSFVYERWGPAGAKNLYLSVIKFINLIIVHHLINYTIAPLFKHTVHIYLLLILDQLR